MFKYSIRVRHLIFFEKDLENKNFLQKKNVIIRKIFFMLGFLFFKKKERKREGKEKKKRNPQGFSLRTFCIGFVLDNSNQIALSWILQSVSATTMDCCILTDLNAVYYDILFHTSFHISKCIIIHSANCSAQHWTCSLILDCKIAQQGM